MGRTKIYQPSLYKLKDSAFALLVDDVNGVVPAADLPNYIHPLFNRYKFLRHSDAEYRELNMALRLASRMLLDDRAAYFITTMVDGSLHIMNDDGTPGQEINPHDLVTHNFDAKRLIRCARRIANPGSTEPFISESMRVRSREILKDLDPVLSEIIVEPPNATGDDSTHFRFSTGSRGEADIYLRNSTAFSHRRYNGDSNAARAYQAHCARTLVHEIAHVVSGGAHGRRSTQEDVFFEGLCSNEAGFNLETLLFGGIVDIQGLAEFLPGSNDGGNVLKEFPDPRIIRGYQPPLEEILLRWPTDKYIRVTRVPWSFISSMFTQRFWNQDVPAFGMGPIQPSLAPSWYFVDVFPGDITISEEGKVTTCMTSGTMPGATCDSTLPLRVREGLRDITGHVTNPW
ncbi:uncharacterized protein RCC_08871 [Ramularia collo-cygni]|uniref:Uncharacterized protein n=1 Tax=Ramularia collo-cygni TaxID=112498 RepID=A0A2D3VG97_9PEZI|nr:uncharacterized protein RCC_08871 [Ramularia collo-cygni]CZT23161.1 uncharacterized protein RCC_08871 [Ramularia collo-cygni]